MKDYFKRLKDHPGTGIATAMTLFGGLAGATNHTFTHWYNGLLFGLVFMAIFTWGIVLLSNFK